MPTISLGIYSSSLWLSLLRYATNYWKQRSGCDPGCPALASQYYLLHNHMGAALAQNHQQPTPTEPQAAREQPGAFPFSHVLLLNHVPQTTSPSCPSHGGEQIYGNIVDLKNTNSFKNDSDNFMVERPRTAYHGKLGCSVSHFLLLQTSGQITVPDWMVSEAPSSSQILCFFVLLLNVLWCHCWSQDEVNWARRLSLL